MTTKPACCKICKLPYTKTRPLQTICGYDCSVVLAEKHAAKTEKIAIAKAKAERRDDGMRRLAIKTRAQWLKETQVAFNNFIRKRDADLSCISCRRHHTGQYHSGHYMSVGARPELRFVEINAHKQCSACNTHLSGNIVLYRKHLIDKIGMEMVDWLEGPHKSCHYDIEQLKAIKKSYVAMARNLRNDQ